MSVMKYFYEVCEELQQEMMDGSMDMDDVIDSLSQKFPSVNREYLQDEFNNSLHNLAY